MLMTMMKISDLPCDLETEILARVPAKSLAKLKTTCKRWYSLFKDPKFVEKNLEQAAAKEEVILKRHGVYSISFNNLHGSSGGDPPSMDITSTLRCLKDLKDLEISQTFHCNGLVLCSTMSNPRRLVVWNPCTGETRDVKPRNCYYTTEFDTFCLGYGNSKSDYKILKFFGSHDEYRERIVFKFDIYDLRSDSWKMLDDVTQKWFLVSYGVSLKGNTYWLASQLGDFNLRTILGFDYRTERFVSFPLPFQPDVYIPMPVLSVVKQEKIALLYQDFGTLSIETTIWLTNKIDEGKPVSWTRFLVVDFLNFTAKTCKSMESFLVDEEKKVAVCCSRDLLDERVFVHIVGKDLLRQVYRESTPTEYSYENWPCLVSYVPSLVRIREEVIAG